MNLNQILIALIISVCISLIAWWRKSLTKGGALAATFTGTIIFGLGGLKWGILLFFFFVSSSILSKYKTRLKEHANAVFEKGSQRDQWQVFANGGAAIILASLVPFWSSEILFIIYIGVISTVTADTWATEIGTLTRQRPRLITNFQPCSSGTSGGISFFGTLSSLMAGIFIGAMAAIMFRSSYINFMLIASISGLLGCLIDSLIGATLQQTYICETCQQQTERKEHCGQVTKPHRGLAWVNNDLVNFLSSIAGGAIAWGIYSVLANF